MPTPHTPLKTPEPADYLELLRAIATSANEAASVEEALQTCLHKVCALTGWSIGHVYLCADGSYSGLESTTLWQLEEDERFETFRLLTESTRFPAGEGLPGRVLATGEPAWISDVSRDPNFLRAQAAEDAGVKSGFAFPLLIGPEVVGVLEFFSTEAVELDERLLGVMADIGTQLGRVVERDRAERALRESELRFRSVTQSAIDAIISADSTGAIRFWNRGAEEIFGYTQGEILGKSLSILMPERYRLDHEQGMERVNTTGETHVIGQVVELHGLRKDGSEFPLELSLGAWATAEGAFYSGIIRDITERRRAEAAIKQLNEELEGRVAERTAQLLAVNEELKVEIAERKRLEQQKDDFIAVASHELRTPLTAIKGYTRLALRAIDQLGDERLIRMLYIVDSKTDQLTRLVSDMLDVSRVESGNFPLHCEPFHLSRLVAEVVSSHELIAPGFTFILNLPAVPTIVNADSQRIEQVIANLVENAVKYSGKRSDDSHKVEISVIPAGGEVVTSVRDYGVGIPAEQQGEVFGRFFRADNVTSAHYPYPGLGLGLFISYNIVSRHGGRMWVESVQGVGSTFFFALPLFTGS